MRKMPFLHIYKTIFVYLSLLLGHSDEQVTILLVCLTAQGAKARTNTVSEVFGHKTLQMPKQTKIWFVVSGIYIDKGFFSKKKTIPVLS